MHGELRFAHVPKLDVASLENLIASLDSQSEDEVIAALGILERERESHPVPTLILYHPKSEVVISALRLFSRTKRRAALHAIDSHLLASPMHRIRAEAYAARAAIEPDAALLRRGLDSEESPAARAAVAASLAASGLLNRAEARRTLENAIEGADESTLVVVCEILGWRGAAEFDDVVVRLAETGSVDVRKAALHSLGDLATARSVEALVRLLGEKPLQRSVRAALARTGAAGFHALAASLRDASVPSPVRWAIPRAIARCDPERAAPLLLRNLRQEPDGMVRVRSIVYHVVELRLAKFADELAKLAEQRKGSPDVERALAALGGAAQSRRSAGHRLELVRVG